MHPTLVAEPAVEREANLIRFAEFQPGVITYRDSPPWQVRRQGAPASAGL